MKKVRENRFYLWGSIGEQEWSSDMIIGSYVYLYMFIILFFDCLIMYMYFLYILFVICLDGMLQCNIGIYNREYFIMRLSNFFELI